MATDPGATLRLNYFNSQLLDESDFGAEQDYHVGQRRRLNRSLHSWGVAGGNGLQVTKAGDRLLRIGAGLAIDREGREIVLPADLDVDLDAVKALPRAQLFVTLRYGEVPDQPVQDAGNANAVNFRRMAERALVALPDSPPPGDGSVVPLASVRLDASGNVAEIDNRVRTLAGSVFDPQADFAARGLTLAAGARIGGALDVQHGSRSGAHPDAPRALYVTGDLGADRDGVEFRRSDGTQGIGIGSTTLYAAGSAPDQDLNLRPRGKGRVSVGGGLQVTGPADGSGGIEFRTGDGSRGVGLDAGAVYAAGSDAEQDLHLRPRGRGRVIAEGDLHAAGNLSSGSPPRPVVVGPDAHLKPLRMIYGLVLDNTTVVSGMGFEVSKPPNRPGIYDIVFRPAFAARPSATVSQVFPAPDLQRNAQGAVLQNDGGDPRDNAVIVGIEPGMMRVKVGGATGVPADRHFSFVVVGPR